MKYIKAKFLKDGNPTARSYTYKATDDVKPGDIVKNINGTKLMVTDEPVDENWLKTYGAENISTVKKYVEENKTESEGK